MDVQQEKWVFGVLYDPKTGESVVMRNKDFNFMEQICLYESLTMFMLQFANEYDVEKFIREFGNANASSLKEDDKKALCLQVFREMAIDIINSEENPGAWSPLDKD